MKRQITIEQLRVGMYVEQVDRDWLSIPFFRHKITSERQIENLRQHQVRTVQIDSERGLDVEGGAVVAQAGARINSDFEVAPAREAEPAITAPETPSSNGRTSYGDELGPAKKAYGQAVQVIEEVLHESRSGKYLTHEPTREAVSDLVDSCMRNDDALVSLTKLLVYDEYTFSHCVNVTVFSIALGKSMGLEREELQRFGESVLLHDVGKMLVPQAILNKPDKLTAEEYDTMKLHVDRGVELLRESFPRNDYLWQVALEHHERIDGSGYPHGTKGDGISQWGQISAVADVYDAMTSQRCYREAMNPHRAMGMLFQKRESDFNGLMVERFIETVGIYPVGSLVRLSTDEIGLIATVPHHDLLHPEILVLYQNGRRLRRPRLRALSSTEPDGPTVQDVLNPKDFGIDPGEILTEVSP